MSVNVKYSIISNNKDSYVNHCYVTCIHRKEPRISDCALSDWLLIRKKCNDRKRSHLIY